MTRTTETQSTQSPLGLLNPKAAAAFLDLSEWTLAQYRCEGTGPRYAKLGNRVKYTIESLQEWVESLTFGSTINHKRARR